ncbi:hypothetical protein [Vibrio sp. SCSIO 43135]|uniref:hypothetical protein n=1 Tax=Vibrio sp. SCSIO 43135 TaxID=2819096 RepID=UPI0020758EB0|nr:hypothetical protein [Vibrio sp. SCSIO 43135]
MNRAVFFFVLLIQSALCQAAQFSVVSLNPTLTELKSSEIKMLYRGRLTSIQGVPPKLADLPSNSPDREAFYYQILRKSPSQMNAIWARLSFSGKASAPFELDSSSNEAVLIWLRENENGIAYLPSEEVTKEMNILYKTNSKARYD